jgi:hypothetical protein
MEKNDKPNEVKDTFREAMMNRNVKAHKKVSSIGFNQSRWSMWLKKPIETKKALVAISVGIAPDLLDLVEEVATTGYYQMSHIPDEDVSAAEEKYRKYKQLLDVVNSHLSFGSLVVSSCSLNSTYIVVSDFVDWLDDTGVLYPDEMKNCFRAINDNQLSSRGKSSLSQENSTLKSLFNKMVILHYGGNVSSYRIEEDLKEKGLMVSGKTIGCSGQVF